MGTFRLIAALAVTAPLLLAGQNVSSKGMADELMDGLKWENLVVCSTLFESLNCTELISSDPLLFTLSLVEKTLADR